MDYPIVSPELSAWADIQRARFVAATDEQEWSGFRVFAKHGGNTPALESFHVICNAMELGRP
jgi:tryptophan synthase beta subunit